MTNVKVYVSSQNAGAQKEAEEEEKKKNRGEGEREEMPCIPLTGQRQPQREGRRRQK